MKRFFIVIFCFLAVATAVTVWINPEVKSHRPILYWVTDSNPIRKQQVQGFHKWLVNHGHVTVDGKPEFELRLDTGNRQMSKIVIQGVSGVGGDVISLTGGGQMRYLQQMGLLEDITEEAKKGGFDPSQTWSSMESEICIVDPTSGIQRQYMFPSNVGVNVMWVNLSTFEKYGLKPPPDDWTIDTFEKIGKQLVKAAAEQGQGKKIFLAPYVERLQLARSLGLSVFNETLTASTISDPRFSRVIKLIYKWQNTDNILPSRAERISFDTEAGFGGPRMQLFRRGIYALLPVGRWGLIAMRRFGTLKIKVVAPPYFEFSNVRARPYGVVVYKGSRYKKQAMLFLSYLASEPANKIIVDTADALPPNPEFVNSEEFKYPPAYPNEWGAHEAIARMLDKIAIPVIYSPYVQPLVSARIETDAVEKFFNGFGNIEVLMQTAENKINAEIQRNLKEYPGLRVPFEKNCILQKKIALYRAAGRKVPLQWIKNPFYKRYYMFKGWAAKGDCKQ